MTLTGPGSPQRKLNTYLVFADVSQAFLASCRVILHEDEEAVSKKVKVEVASPNAVAQMQIASLRAIVGWDCLSLRYRYYTDLVIDQ